MVHKNYGRIVSASEREPLSTSYIRDFNGRSGDKFFSANASVSVEMTQRKQKIKVQVSAKGTKKQEKELGMTEKSTKLKLKNIHLGNIELNNNQILDHR